MSVDAVIVHGGQLHQIAARFGVAQAGLVDFSANINPDGPPPSVVEALQHALSDPATLTLYPDLQELDLRRSIAVYAAVDVANVAVANGFVPLLDAVLRELKLQSCLLPMPCFGEYRSALARAGVATTAFQLDQDHDFRYRTADLMAALVAGNHDSILLANPQNPSGVLLDRNEMLAFVAACAEAGVRVLLDEAFIDYCPGQSLVGDVASATNLIVFRSVTKFHGVPALRAAYAVAPAPLRLGLANQLPPWSITTLAAIGVEAALADKGFAAEALRMNLERREPLERHLHLLGVYCYPAAANYLLARLESAARAQRCWERLIVDHGLVLRQCDSFEGLGPGHLRIAVRSDVDNARLMQALTEVRP